MNLTHLINVTIFKPIFIIKLLLNVKLTLNVTFSVLCFPTKSFIYNLKLITCINYLQINGFQVVVVNIEYLF